VGECYWVVTDAGRQTVRAWFAAEREAIDVKTAPTGRKP